MYKLNTVESLYNYYSTYGDVLIAGDLNSSCISRNHTNTMKAQALTAFITRCCICMPSVDFNIQGEKHTFIPKCTMLDYILFSKIFVSNLIRYRIFEEGLIPITSDHLPVLAEFRFSCTHQFLNRSNAKFPAWHKASADAIVAYMTSMRHVLEIEITVPSSTHTGRHEHFVDDLVSTLTKSATHNIPHSGYNPHTRPGWTKDVKHLHTKEREMRRIWLAEGRPRGMIFEFYRNYKRAKRHFRVALDNEFNNYMKSVYHDLDTRSRM